MIIVFLVALVALSLVAIGIIVELNAHSQLDVTLDADDKIDSHPSPRVQRGLLSRFNEVAQKHPRKGFAIFETVLWMLFLVPLIDHLVATDSGLTSQIVWAMTIGPHEVGHFICAPFGEFLMVAGGSIWQVLFWLLLAIYALAIRRRLIQALLLLMVVGHSFINLSVYISDAQERELPLLFGLGPEAHDWGNLLEWTGLLGHDDLIAALSVIIGGGIVLFSIAAGVVVTWTMPGAR